MPPDLRAAGEGFLPRPPGVELEPGEPITVMWYIDADVITIPGEQARVSTETARRAVVEYVQTGQRPTCVSWEPGA